MALSDDLAAEALWLGHLARRLVGPGADADDLAQETLRVALAKRERAPGAAVRQWLSGIARRLALVGWRDDARRRGREVDAARTEPLPSAAETVAAAEARALLVRAVLALEEPLRTAVTLRFLEGHSYADISAQLGVTQAAARQRVSRGVAVLREELGAGGELGPPRWLAALAAVPSSRSLPNTPWTAAPAAIIMQTKMKWAVGTAIAIAGAAVVGWRQLPLEAIRPEPLTSIEVSDGDLAELDDFTAVAGEPGAQRLDLPVDLQAESTGAAAAEPRAALAQDIVTVHVQDLAGRPVNVAEVELRPDWSAGFGNTGFDRFQGGPIVRARATSSPGEFLARVPKDRRYRVIADADGWAEGRLDDVSAGSEVTVVLQLGATFRGTVRSREDQIPIEGAQVRAFHGEEWVHVDVRTDASGEFLFEDLNAGPGAFFVSPPNHAPTRHTELEFESSHLVRRDVEVDTGWSLSGQVVDASTGVPVADAEVSAWSFQGKNVRTDSSGRFALHGLTQLPGEVYARAPGFAVAKAEYQGASQDVELRLGRAVALVGRLVGSGGFPLKTGFVGHIQWSADPHLPAAVEADGSFRIEGLDPALSVRLTARSLGFASLTRDVDLQAMETAGEGVMDLGDLVLPRAGAIEGGVRWTDGQPAEGRVVLQIIDPDTGEAVGHGRGSYLDDSGRFSFLELGPGRYEVLLQSANLPPMKETVVLGEGERHDAIRWTLPVGVTVDGRVLDPSETPVEHAYVHLSAAEDEHWRGTYKRTDAEGRFRFEHFSAERYRLYFSADRDTRLRSPDAAGLLPTVVVGEVAEAVQVDVVLRRANAPVAGRVLDADGRPVPLAYVCRDDGSGQNSQGVLADDSGRFEIMVDGAADTVLMAWATAPFDAREERQNLTSVSFTIQRDLVGDRDAPLATAVRTAGGSFRSPGASTSGQGSGSIVGQ